SRRRHTRFDCDWSSDVCSSDLAVAADGIAAEEDPRADQHFDIDATARSQPQPEVERHAQGRRIPRGDQTAESAFDGKMARESTFDGEGELEDAIVVEDVIPADAESHLRGRGERSQREHRESCERDPCAHGPPLYGAREPGKAPW